MSKRAVETEASKIKVVKTKRRRNKGENRKETKREEGKTEGEAKKETAKEKNNRSEKSSRKMRNMEWRRRGGKVRGRS